MLQSYLRTVWVVAGHLAAVPNVVVVYVQGVLLNGLMTYCWANRMKFDTVKCSDSYHIVGRNHLGVVLTFHAMNLVVHHLGRQQFVSRQLSITCNVSCDKQSQFGLNEQRSFMCFRGTPSRHFEGTNETNSHSNIFAENFMKNMTTSTALFVRL